MEKFAKLYSLSTCSHCRATKKYLDECQHMSSRADLMIVVGSSLAVFPAAFLPSFCRGNIIIVNKGEISLYSLPHERISLHAEEDIDEFFEEVNHILNIVWLSRLLVQLGRITLQDISLKNRIYGSPFSMKKAGLLRILSVDGISFPVQSLVHAAGVRQLQQEEHHLPFV